MRRNRITLVLLGILLVTTSGCASVINPIGDLMYGVADSDTEYENDQWTQYSTCDDGSQFRLVFNVYNNEQYANIRNTTNGRLRVIFKWDNGVTDTFTLEPNEWQQTSRVHARHDATWSFSCNYRAG